MKAAAATEAAAAAAPVAAVAVVTAAAAAPAPPSPPSSPSLGIAGRRLMVSVGVGGEKTGQAGEGGGEIRRAKITSVRARSAARLPRHERGMRIPPPIFTDLSSSPLLLPPTTGPKIAALQSLSTPGGSCGGPTHAPTRTPPATAAPSLPFPPRSHAGIPFGSVCTLLRVCASRTCTSPPS